MCILVNDEEWLSTCRGHKVCASFYIGKKASLDSRGFAKGMRPRGLV